MSLYDEASLMVTPNAYKSGKLYAVKPTDGSGDMVWSRAGTKTRVNPNGLVESIGANVPSIDFTGGGCPSILVEPQATNLLLKSEDFSTMQIAFGGVISFDSLFVNPRGENGCYFIYDSDSSASARFTVSTPGFVFGEKISYSIFAKPTGTSNLEIGGNYGGESAVFNLVTKTLVSQGTAVDSYEIKDFANGWTRYIVNTTFQNVVVGNPYPFFVTSAPLSNKIYVWGHQMERGSVATSYIPTTTTAVTRVADVATVTPPVGTTEITETFDGGTTNIITLIPSTYQLPNGRIKSIVMK